MEISYEIIIKKNYKNLTIDELANKLKELKNDPNVTNWEMAQCYDCDSEGRREFTGYCDLCVYVTGVSKDINTAFTLAKDVIESEEESN